MQDGVGSSGLLLKASGEYFHNEGPKLFLESRGDAYEEILSLYLYSTFQLLNGGGSDIRAVELSSTSPCRRSPHTFKDLPRAFYSEIQA